MLTDILCYQAAGNYVEYRRAAEDAATRSETWPTADLWSHIVPGQFSAQEGVLTQLVLYHLDSGNIQIASIEATPDGGSLTVFAAAQIGWRPGWTHIVPGSFSPGVNHLFFYDANQGAAAFYVLNGSTLELVHSFNTRTGWHTIVPGNFGGDSVTDLLFYDAVGKTGVFYSVDADSLNPTPLATHTNWRSSWFTIVPGNFGGDAFTDLLFYDPDAGLGEFYSVSQGAIKLLSSKNVWARTWNTILPGNFSGGTTTDLFFYDPYDGIAQFYSTAKGQLATSLGYFTDWRNSWNNLAAGTFLGNIVPSVLTLDRSQAQNAATGAGLAYYFNGSGSETAAVIAQRPPAGQVVNAGDALVMTMG